MGKRSRAGLSGTASFLGGREAFGLWPACRCRRCGQTDTKCSAGDYRWSRNVGRGRFRLPIERSRVYSTRCKEPLASWSPGRFSAARSGGYLRARRSVVAAGGQGPAPAGEFAGDRDVGYHGTFSAFEVGDPAVVQTLVAGMPSGSCLRRGFLPSGANQPGRVVIGSAVVPGRLDEKPPGRACFRLY